MALLVLLALAAVSAWAVHVRLEDRAKRRETRARLEELALLLENHDLGHTTVDLPPPRAVPAKDDPTGMRALHEYLMGGHYLLVSDPGTRGDRFLRGELDRDAWGRPIHYRCPGVVHRGGWDFYSFGPDGVDDEGSGDDVVVGAEGAAADADRAQVSSSSW